ncbi:MAG: hypothetical protein ACPLPT_00330 [Moorellales bacterium]
MGYLLILLGITLVALTLKPALSGRPERPGSEPQGPPERDAVWEELLERLSTLEERLLASGPPVGAGSAAEEGSRGACGPTEAGGSPAFGEILGQLYREDWRQQVYAAYDAGEGIEDIARRLGRGKGEVELILRLRSTG